MIFSLLNYNSLLNHQQSMRKKYQYSAGRSGKSQGKQPNFSKSKPKSNKSQTKTKKYSVVFMFISDEQGAVSIPYEIWADPIKTFIKSKGAVWCPIFKVWKVSRVQLEYIKKDLPSILTAQFEDVPSFVKRSTEPLSQKLFLHKQIYVKQSMALEVNPLYNKLYQFQRQTLQFCNQRFGRILIADEMGVGKSVQSLACTLLYNDSFPILIICPSALKHVWKDEVGKWLKDRVNINQVFIIKKGVLKGSQLKNMKVVITSYEIAAKLINQLNYIKMVICDEAHYLKNPQSNRCTILMPFLTNRKRVFLLTGTPALAKPQQLFTLLSILRPDLFTTLNEFGNRYCFKRINPWSHKMQFDGAKNLAELHYVLKKTVMIRRLKSQVLPQLPSKQRQIIYMQTQKSVAAEIKSLLNEAIPIDKMRQSDKLLQMFDQQGKQRVQMTRCYLLSAIAKLQSMKEYITAILQNDVKILIFAHHRDVMDQLQNHIKTLHIQYIRLDGDSSAETRKKKVDQFQQISDIRVALLSLTAMGTGFTLTAASTVIFAQLHWTPAILIQAQDRTHRIGQQQSVNIHYLIGDNTLDPLMMRQLERKIGTVAKVLDGQIDSLNVEIVPKGELGNFELQPISSKSGKGQKITDYFRPSKYKINQNSQFQASQQMKDEFQIEQQQKQQYDDGRQSQQQYQKSQDSLLIEFIRKKKQTKKQNSG